MFAELVGEVAGRLILGVAGNLAAAAIVPDTWPPPRRSARSARRRERHYSIGADVGVPYWFRPAGSERERSGRVHCGRFLRTEVHGAWSRVLPEVDLLDFVRRVGEEPGCDEGQVVLAGAVTPGQEVELVLFASDLTILRDMAGRR